MRKLVSVLLLLAALPLLAQQPDEKASSSNLAILFEPLGDSEAGVVSRVTFRYVLPDDVPPQGLALQGSMMQGGQVVKNFRFMLNPNQRDSARTIVTLQPGPVEIEARLIISTDELVTPILVGKQTKTFTVAKTNKPYVASESDGAEAILAEGIVPESVGSVKILPPRRDVAPNLFVVEVEAAPKVKRVEFWVEGKKIMARNAPPFRAELDLGKLPKRVEVRAVGYDAQGHYIDADAFVVNERETPLEVKITRTVTPDNVSHIKLSVQNPKNTEIKSAVLYAGQKKIYEWSQPPYAIDIPNARLAGVEFVRASVLDETNYEASDLLFLNGDRYTEEIDVNLVELPVTVADPAGIPIGGLEQKSFQILENGKPQKISAAVEERRAGVLSSAANAIMFGSAAPNPRPASSRVATSVPNSPMKTTHSVNTPNIATEVMNTGLRPTRSASQPPSAAPNTMPMLLMANTHFISPGPSPNSGASRGAATPMAWISKPSSMATAMHSAIGTATFTTNPPWARMAARRNSPPCSAAPRGIRTDIRVQSPACACRMRRPENDAADWSSTRRSARRARCA